MTDGPIIRRERWRSPAGDEPIAAPNESTETAPTAAPQAAPDAVASGAEETGRSLPVIPIAIAGLVIGVGGPIAAYVALAGSPEVTTPAPDHPEDDPREPGGPEDDKAADDTIVEPPPTPSPGDPARFEESVEILERLWRLASLADEEVASLEIAFELATPGTPTHETLSFAIESKQEERRAAIMNLAAHVQELAVAARVSPDAVLGAIKAATEEARDNSRTSAASWLRATGGYINERGGERFELQTFADFVESELE